MKETTKELLVLFGILCLFVVMIVAVALGTGCAHRSHVPLDNTPLLIAHPQFVAAAQAAPEFAREALATIARLEHEVAAAAPFGVEVATPAKQSE
jgi:hypothetical protein